MLARLRSHLTYANVVSTIALCLVVGGGSALAANTIFSSDIVDGEVKNNDLAANAVGSGKIADLSVKNADLSIGASSSNTIADGGIQGVDVKANTLTGAQIAESTLFNDDSLTGADIANPTRSVNIPLASFLDVGLPGAIDFDSSNNAFSPDFETDGAIMFLAFDDDSGANDSSAIGSSFSLPPDYASGATLALRVSKDAHTATQTERFFCSAFHNGGNAGFGNLADITTADNAVYTINLDFHPYAAGDAVNLQCQPESGTHDDVVRLHSIEFRYTATQ